MYAKYLKRVLDFVLSLLALIVLFPVLLILTVLGAIKMKGNPFFTQKRPGKNEKIFNLIKFRSMTCEKDAQGNLLPDDQRLTRYGRILRSTSLDELPELINILIGDMSIVGPRPCLPREAEQYDDYAKQRLLVPQGLTCYWQIQPNRNQKTFEEWLELDIRYIKERSFWTDWKIILLTFIALLRMDGE